MSLVAWHDVECGGYEADLELWRALATQAPGPVLDVGAGTGRVALDLATHGFDVVALDLEPELLAALRARPGGDAIRTVAQDATALELPGERFGLIAVPMQTIQLLADRAAFLRAARAHLLPGGLLAAALADPPEPFEGPLPTPDVQGRFVSQPTAVRLLDGVMRLERMRDDGHEITHDVIELALLTPDELAAEAMQAGFTPRPARRVPETADHVGSTVVIARA